MSCPLPHDVEKHRELERHANGTGRGDVRRLHRKIFLCREQCERMEQLVHLEAIMEVEISF
jgi:hypothetical protein